jgi:hypothetical protein
MPFEAWADLLVISSPQLTMPWCPPSSQRRSRVEKSVGRLLTVKERYDLRGAGWH